MRVLSYVCVCVGGGGGCTDALGILCAGSLNYTACDTPPFCHLRLWLHQVFPNYLTNDTIFEKKKKKVTEYKMCFDFLYKFDLEHLSSYEKFSAKLS
jgi:hypothetical protein